MPKSDTGGGFLSKVAKFVRHPTTSWADLDSPLTEQESEFNKAAFKELIERRRRNDFVRKREFDMLRKIRSRASAEGQLPAQRPSSFQNSLPSTLEERASTIKKIDEIEAQMSTQWWKQRDPATTISGTSLSGTERFGAQGVQPADQAAFQDTDPVNTLPLGLVRSAPGHAAHAPGDRGDAGRPADGRLDDVDSSVFSASHFQELDAGETAQDPQIEEACIRFANGDDAGAEAVLMQAVEDARGLTTPVDDWRALFDLYRATGRQASFESCAQQFASQFNRPAPPWYSLVTDEAGAGDEASVALGGEIQGEPQAMLTALEPRLSGAEVWAISCRHLVRVDFAAAGTLLNWVAAHHAKGRDVRLVDVNRLVAAFFHVIGITAHAQVVLRDD